MDIGLYFEEYGEGWCHETGPTVVTEQGIRSFVELHGFRTPTFTDDAYVRNASDYGDRMAPGLFVLSLAEGLALNSGVTRRRGIFLMALTPEFKRPVFAGDSIINRIRLKSKRQTSKPDRGVVVTSHEVVNNRGDVVIVYDSTRMIRTRLYVESSDGG